MSRHPLTQGLSLEIAVARSASRACSRVTGIQKQSVGVPEIGLSKTGLYSELRLEADDQPDAGYKEGAAEQAEGCGGVLLEADPAEVIEKD